MLTADLKGRMGFAGWVMSDWWAITDSAAVYHVDQEMPGSGPSPIKRRFFSDQVLRDAARSPDGVAASPASVAAGTPSSSSSSSSAAAAAAFSAGGCALALAAAAGAGAGAGVVAGAGELEEEATCSASASALSLSNIPANFFFSFLPG